MLRGASVELRGQRVTDVCGMWGDGEPPNPVECARQPARTLEFHALRRHRGTTDNCRLRRLVAIPMTRVEQSVREAQNDVFTRQVHLCGLLAAAFHQKYGRVKMVYRGSMDD